MISPGGERQTLTQFIVGASLSNLISIVSSQEVTERLDAEHFSPVFRVNTENLKVRFETEQVGNWGKVLKGRSVKYLEEEIGIPVIRSGDLTDIEETPELKHTNTSQNPFLLQRGDICISSIGAGSIGKIQVFDKSGPFATVSEVTVIRQKRLNPYYLQAFLRSMPGQLQIEQWITGATGQLHLYPRDVEKIVVPIVSSEEQNVYANLSNEAKKLRAFSRQKYTQAQQTLVSAIGLDTLELPPQLSYTAMSVETNTSKRLDPEYFQPKYQRAMAIVSHSGQTLKDVAKLVKRRFKPNTGVPFEYIEIGNITNDGRAQSDTVMGEEAPSRAQFVVKGNDIITSTVRPIRRLSALIESDQDGFVCSSGFAVLQPTHIEPELLLLYLRLPIVAEILDLHTTATMYPAISTTDLMRIPITIPDEQTTKQIVEKVREARQARVEANQLLETAKYRVEQMILGEHT